MPFIPIVALIFEAAAYIVSPEASRLIVDVFPLLVPILAIFPEPSALLSVNVSASPAFPTIEAPVFVLNTTWLSHETESSVGCPFIVTEPPTTL